MHVQRILPSYGGGDNVPQFMSRVESTEDPPCHAEDPPDLRLELRADQPTPLAQRTVSWKQGTSTSAEQPTQQSRQTYPPCQAPISVNLSGMEQYLKKLSANFSKPKRKVVILEQEQEEHADEQQKIQEKFQELMDLWDSHDAEFRHEVNNNVEFRQSMSSEAHALKGQKVQFQIELRKHFDDHKKSEINEILRNKQRS